MKLTTVALVLSTAGIAAEVPKTWDERALADWATPVAGLNVRPGHFSEREYYAAPVDNLRTYPVYDPEHEPAGYWEALQKKTPEPLLEIGREARELAEKARSRRLQPSEYTGSTFSVSNLGMFEIDQFTG